MLYFALSLAVCWGMVRHPLSRIPFYIGDGLLTFWNYWWARTSIVDLHTSPLATTYLSYPHESSLVFQAHDLLHGVLSIPVQLLIPGRSGLILSVNLAIFFCYFVSAFAAYLCVELLTKHRGAAIIAGFGYAFSAFHSGWYSMPVIAAMYWLPLFVWLYVRAARKGGRIAVLLPGLCFGLCTFQSAYYTLFLACLAAFLSVFIFVLERGQPHLTRRVAAIAGGIVLFALPMAGVMVADMDTPYVVPGETDSAGVEKIHLDCRNSVDLAGLVVPGPEQGLWDRWAGPWNDYLKRNTPACPVMLFGANGEGGHLSYVGLALLVFAALAWLGAPRRVALAWTLCALFFIGISLGPFLHFHGRIHTEWWLPLPYRLLLAGPSFFAKLFRAPHYFWAAALFSIWILASYGLCWVLSLARSRAISAAVWALIGAWLLVDYGTLPLQTWPVLYSPVFASMAADPRPFAVYPIPNDAPITLETYNFSQTQHGKPLALGFLSRRDTVVERRAQLMRQAERSRNALRLLLEDLGPAYVVVHKQLIEPPRLGAIRSLFDGYEGLTKAYENLHMLVYASAIDPAGGPGFPPPPPPPGQFRMQRK